MSRNISWYANRFQSMSPLEVLFRTYKTIQNNKEKISPKTTSLSALYLKTVLDRSLAYCGDQKIPLEYAELFKDFDRFNVFGLTISNFDEIDWHLDIISGRRFPLTHAKDIDIRSEKFGNAKVVWEINRLQFLLPLAVKYSTTKNPADLRRFIHILTSWFAENPYLKGVNWYSNIEVNLRLIVWYFCWQILWSDPDVGDDRDFYEFALNIWLPGIYEHCIYSVNNPSRYSSANNHLVAEYAGLFVAAHCWPFKEAERWKSYSKKGLEKQIAKQHSKNGVNKEEAAEYIQFITDFFLIAYAVGERNGTTFSQTYKDYLQKIVNYISDLLDVSGGYAKYGDEDDGKVLLVGNDEYFNNFKSLLISAAVIFRDKRFKKADNIFDFKNWLLWGKKGQQLYEKMPAEKVLKRSAFYNDEGHFIFRKCYEDNDRHEIYLHFNAAPLGFLSIAAHGHADALSVVLTLDGNPILVDIGTYTYHTEKEWRRYFVSTLAHNTININGDNQAYYVGPTLWLWHYKTSILHAAMEGNSEIVKAQHSGYKKIGCTHQRTVIFDRLSEKFVILDEVTTRRKARQLMQCWHLHPNVEVKALGKNAYTLRHKDSHRAVRLQLDARLEVKLVNADTAPIMGWYSSSFLQKEPTNVVAGHLLTTADQPTHLQTIIEII